MDHKNVLTEDHNTLPTPNNSLLVHPMESQEPEHY